MRLSDILFDIKFDKEDFNKIKEKLKNSLKSTKTIPIYAVVGNYLITYIDLKTLPSEIAMEKYEPLRKLIQENGIEKGLVLSLPQLLPMILSYYIASSVANVLENFIAKEYGKDIKGTLSSLTLDSLTSLTLPYIFNDVYLLASYLSGTGINVGIPSNPIGIFSAALAISPFVYLISKRYLSKETMKKFKNLYDFLSEAYDSSNLKIFLKENFYNKIKTKFLFRS
jgi:hypothetical protein